MNINQKLREGFNLPGKNEKVVTEVELNLGVPICSGGCW